MLCGKCKISHKQTAHCVSTLLLPQALRAAKDRGVKLHKRKAAELQQELLGQISVKEEELLVKRARSDSSISQLTMLLRAVG